MSEVNVSLRPLPGGVVALDLRGLVDKHIVHALDQTIARLVEQGRNRLVVNCAELQHLSSDGMGIFLSQLIKIRKAGGDIKFCAMNQRARAIVGILELGDLLEVYETEALAVQEFARRDREREEKGRAKPLDQNLSVELCPEGADIMAVRLRGFIDRHTIDTLESALRRALDENRPKVVVNCEGLTYISSNGIGVFIGFVQKTRSKKGDIRFCRMRDIARTVITMLGLQNTFKVYETEAEAIASFRP